MTAESLDLAKLGLPSDQAPHAACLPLRRVLLLLQDWQQAVPTDIEINQNHIGYLIEEVGDALDLLDGPGAADAVLDEQLNDGDPS